MTEPPVDIKGIQQLQAANLQMIRALSPVGAMGQAVLAVTQAMHRVSVILTHVDSGALRASHRIEHQPRNLRGRVFIDPGTVNPRGQRPAEYGYYEHERGGSHAFYRQASDAQGEGQLANGAQVIIRAMPKGWSLSEAR